MKRYGNYERNEETLDSRLIIIAAEGEATEKIYFDTLRDTVRNSRVHVKVLEREELDRHKSSPEFVLEQLAEYQERNALDKEDELWLVIDRDRWTIKSIKSVAQRCAQNWAFSLALSNPCFELWLLLHLEDVAALPEEEKTRILKNKKEGHPDTYLKRKMRHLLGSYQESNYDARSLMPYVNMAVERANIMDVDKQARWPQKLGTRVYLLAQSIKRK